MNEALKPIELPLPNASDYRNAARELRALLRANELIGYLSNNAARVLACLENVVE